MTVELPVTQQFQKWKGGERGSKWCDAFLPNLEKYEDTFTKISVKDQIYAIIVGLYKVFVRVYLVSERISKLLIKAN